jgi:hypothetical protein
LSLTIALAQLNPTVGDIDGNLAKIRRARDEAAAAHADLVVLDRDYFFVADAEIPNIRSLLTVVGGNVSYDAGVL